MNYNRVLKRNDAEQKSGIVIYWMSRDQRINDNWSLIFAQKLAKKYESNLLICFNLVGAFLGASKRHFGFMLRGLEELNSAAKELNIPLKIIKGNPEATIPKFASEIKASSIITDFDPLKIKQQWQNDVLSKIEIPFYEVDSHNIVPCRLASPKQEFGAYTIRPKINKQLIEYLDTYDELEVHTLNSSDFFSEFHSEYKLDLSDYAETPGEVDWIKPGANAANEMLNYFISKKLDKYAEIRNDPSLDGLSNMSPYLHFGQISAQRIALEVKDLDVNPESKKSFLEELIIRRELSDNFCFYNANYNNFNGFHEWAKKTLNEHRADKREFVYDLKDFEQATTHDIYWNAAQKEMLDKGKMHGYMRMYWGKKILEWTPDPETALKYAIYLNDKYELDGRDPNGYVGVAWSIGGVHDRAWGERAVFGKIRFMNDKGLKRKFDINAYIAKVYGENNVFFK